MLKKIAISFSRTIKNTKYMFSLLIKKKWGKSYVLLSALLSVLNASIMIISTLFPGLIINELISYSGDTQKLTLYVTILLFIPFLLTISRLFINRLLKKITFILRTGIETEFYFHLSAVDFEYRESPQIEMKAGRAKDTLQGILLTVSMIFNLLSSLIGLIAVFSIISIINPIIIIIIILIQIVNSVIAKKANIKEYNLKLESDRLSRKLLVSHNPLAQYLYAKEMRIFDLTAYMDQKRMEEETNNYKNEVKRQKNRDFVNISYTIGNLILHIALYVYAIISIINHNLAVGTMTILISASSQFSGSLKKVVDSYLKISNNDLKIEELQEYMSLPLKKTKSGHRLPTFDEKSIIEFQNVSFKYPGSERYVINNLNLIIYGKQRLCIVGENGAGKTTFIKLLTRMFSPTSGRIVLNGYDISEYDFNAYQRLFSAVFQKYNLFEGLTLGENIVLNNKLNNNKLEEVSDDCGLTTLIKKLPNQYDTYISKWVDETGINPSGGEAQRIVIARACYRSAELYILDEPTASLDPLAEYEIYTQFHNMIQEKTAILITHRLSAVKLADKVAVFQDGQVVEYGTHAELYAKGGLYTEMFDKQAQFYRDETNIYSTTSTNKIENQ